MKHAPGLTLLAMTLVLGGAACQKTAPNTQSSGLQIHDTEDNAFGSLADLTQFPKTISESTAAGVSRSTAAVAPVADLKIAPEFVGGYTYVFTGVPVSLTDTSVDVFERNSGVGLDLPDAISRSAGFGVMSFGRLSNPTVDNLTIRSGDEVWYVDAVNGTISMYLDTTARLAEPVEMTEPTNVSADPIAAIALSDAWLADHGVSTAAYATPIVVSTSGVSAAGSATDAAANSVSKIGIVQSSMAQVVYPLLINGVSVVQSNGEPMGLTVTVETATSTITSIYGLNALDFTRSSYAAQTDWSAVQKIAEQGGLYRFGLTESSKKTTVNLGTPDRVLMVSYIYEHNLSRELYVPALRFSLVNAPDTYTKYVVVPLAKDLPSDMPVDMLPPTLGSGSSGTVQPE